MIIWHFAYLFHEIASTAQNLLSKNELGLNSASDYLSGGILNDHFAIIIITDTSEGLFITDFTDTTFQYYLNTANHRLLVKLPQICFFFFFFFGVCAILLMIVFMLFGLVICLIA